MKTIRRIYFYLVTAISVELLAWGLINLLRSIFRSGIMGIQSQALSIGLAQILVSIPIFIIHWLVVQKDADKSEEEQSSLVRAMFQYGILLGTLIPVVQNALAFVNRLLLDTGGGERLTALVGSSQSAPDNLIAVAINLLLAAYFYSVLRKDWRFNPRPASLGDIRRIYHYIWMLYGLGMTILGVQQVLRFYFRKMVIFQADPLAGLVNPTALLLLGVPIWVYTWLKIQRSITDSDERESSWRVAIIYFLTLTGAISTGVAAITAFGWIFKAVLGNSQVAQDLLWKLGPSLSNLLPFAVVWIYFARILRGDIASRADPFHQQAMTRVYRYILAFLGLSGTIAGLIGVFKYLVDYLGGPSMYIMLSFGDQIAQYVALLGVSLVYWLVFYTPENQAANSVEESGEHARRSLTRKIYLYAIVFGCVIGVMVTGGTTLYRLLESLFNGTLDNQILVVVRGFTQMLVFAVFLIYHLVNLRRDARDITRTLTQRHADFPVLFAESPDSEYGKEIAEAFQKTAPSIPLQYLKSDQDIPLELSKVKTVILPSSQITRTESPWQKQLEGYSGKVFILPERNDHWVWIPQPGKTADSAKSVAIAARNLAEGRPVQQQKSVSFWVILGYILAGLLVVMVMMIVLGTVFGG